MCGPRPSPASGPGEWRLRCDREILWRSKEAVGRLTEEMSAVRADLDELAERVDFTERALTAIRRQEVIGLGGRD